MKLEMDMCGGARSEPKDQAIYEYASMQHMLLRRHTMNTQEEKNMKCRSMTLI